MAEQKPKASKPVTVKVSAVFGRFIEQHTGAVIESEPVEVELTPWVQANIDAGLLVTR